MGNGWIKLHRQFLNWEWYSDINVCRLFMHCILKANHAPNRWRGIMIESGQFISSRDALAKETCLSVQQIRTSLNKLKSTNELTIKTTSKFTLISITCWEKYQNDNQQHNQQSTNNQPTSNQQVTTNKNEKNEKNEKEKNTSLSPKADPVPYQKIIDLYHKTLPDLPAVAKLTPKRKSQIRQRFKEDMKELVNWENFFDYVSQSDFLMGRVQPTNGRAAFRADIEWLTNSTNFTKIAEDKYHVQ